MYSENENKVSRFETVMGLAVDIWSGKTVDCKSVSGEVMSSTVEVFAM